MKKVFIIGFILIALIFVGWAVSFFFPSTLGWIAAAPPSLTPATSATSTNPVQTGIGKVSGRPAPSGFVEYYNPQYHFSLLYPTTLKVSEHPEDGGAITVTFEDIEPKTVMGFQIFIVPFDGSQITDARFKEDNPSGVRQSLTNIQVDGAVGAAFYSTDNILGATREVWFLQGGYLYEVTTFKELDTWLDSIIQTWKFTP